jgi:hypothetical protein
MGVGWADLCFPFSDCLAPPSSARDDKIIESIIKKKLCAIANPFMLAIYHEMVEFKDFFRRTKENDILLLIPALVKLL